MTRSAARPLVAVLGPTNTGKTHLAVERMCGHSSGLIGFPLRLLAREVYDRVVAIKGAAQVALVTGEEKIVPPNARWFLTTAESMPVLSSPRGGRVEGPVGGGREGPAERDFAFVALDEAQLAADRARGHVFTDRLLRARGREETMLLGSDALRPMLKALVPDAEIVTRPRFSTLSYAGPAKLSRLPKRSVIVAFSAEEVYAVAEMLRRLRGGAAVVMGSLSPRTRNAQVAMFQAGEVDYLVATDAIGMGLNMDVAHVAFASLRKFDGRRTRRLTIPEMAQIAGRAGRHQRDGTFGSLSLEGGEARFEDEEVAAIEGHHMPPLDHLYWRDGDPSTASLDRLIADLERRPDRPVLRPAPEAIDLAVLKRLADEPWVRERARGGAIVARLWEACGLPDFRKTGAEAHARLVGRVFRHLTEGDGRIPVPWFAEELVRLESAQGDVETLADRLAGVRTWAYIAHRRDWLAEPALWAERARGIEEKLSDALHQRLTQRFVDRRTAVLMRDLGARGADLLPMKVAEDGTVTVDGEAIGLLVGFRFKADPLARHGDMKRLMAAAERRLGAELAARARALVADEDAAFSLATDPGRPVALFWRGDVVARLTRGKALLGPRIEPHRALDALPEPLRDQVCARLRRWLDAGIARHLAPLAGILAAARDPATPAAVRALLAPLGEAGGVVARRGLEPVLDALGRADRPAVAALGARLGTLDLFVPALVKPEPARWRVALAAAQEGQPMPALPPIGAVSVPTPADAATCAAFVLAGFRPLGAQMLRVDQVERLARAAHDARTGRGAFVPDPGLATSLGLASPSFHQLMLALGFRRAEEGWRWKGAAPRARPPEVARAARQRLRRARRAAVLMRRRGAPYRSHPTGVSKMSPIASRLLAGAAALGLGYAVLGGGSLAAETAVRAPAPAVTAPASAASETAVFAGGCFWGVQGVYAHVKGVTSAVSGFTGGSGDTAHYGRVSDGNTGHAESVRVTFDPRVVSYADLLRVYFSVVADPTQLNAQGPDEGTQYRSALFPQSAAQAKVAQAYLAQLRAARLWPRPIVTRLERAQPFYPAEAYHQDYLTLHPDADYIRYNDMPKLVALKRLYPQLWREKPVLVKG